MGQMNDADLMGVLAIITTNILFFLLRLIGKINHKPYPPTELLQMLHV